MFQHYLKSTWRSMMRYKGFTAINLAGLTLALTGCLFIGLFVWDELKFDQFHEDKDRVFRIYTKSTDEQGQSLMSVTTPMMATVLKKEFPEVESTLRIMKIYEKQLFEVGQSQYYEDHGIYAEPGFFEMFSLPMKEVGSDSLLTDPLGIIISSEMAAKYFGTENALGKTILVSKSPLKVAGVLDKISPYFHLNINYIIPFSNLARNWAPSRMENWVWQQFHTYVKLKPHTTAALVENKLQQLVKERAHPVTKESGFTYLPYLQPLPDIHLTSAGFEWDIIIPGNILYIKALVIIAIFVLVIAGFNFVNLATARALRRAKEVGVRKTVGAGRYQLMFQFMSESVVVAIAAMATATLITYFGVPALNSFTGKNIFFEPLTHPGLAGLLFGFGLLVGLLAGVYPAVLMSGFRPVNILKGVFHMGTMSFEWLRKGMVVVQFALSVLLIVCSMIVYRQVHYMQSKDLGFNKDQLVFFPMRGDQMFKNHGSFKNELLQQPGVVSATIGYGFPGDIVSGDNIIVPGENGPKTIPARQFMIDYDYIKTMNLQLIAGRDFSKQFQTDKDAGFIINETGVKELGLGSPQQAIGKPLHWNIWGANSADSLKKGTVIGVVKDFHFESLHDIINTAVLQIFPDAYWKVALKINPRESAKTLAGIQEVWKRFSPDYPLEYQFLDENINKMYVAEDKLSTLLWIFTLMAIFVGCLGLFGLATYAAEQRIKEIGIRKVLGAGVAHLVVLLSRDFLMLVGIAAVLAIPLAWWVMQNWMEDFAYRARISIWIFIAAVLSSVLIALLTICSQAIRAAVSNPVESLRIE